jgi:hypothetical protein
LLSPVFVNASLAEGFCLKRWGLKSSRPLLKEDIFPMGVELGSADFRRQKMALLITICIVHFSDIEGYGK